MKILLAVIALLALTQVNAQSLADSKDSGAVALENAKGKPAEYPGGQQGWLRFLERNMKYPDAALKKNIQGTVRIQFVIAPDGSISAVEALNDPGGGLAEEAIRLIKKSGRWVPAELDGKNVSYRHIQAFVFRLEVSNERKRGKS